LVKAQGRRCLGVGDALFFNHFLDDTKDLDLLASAVHITLLVDTAIDSVKGTGMTEATLVVDMELHVSMKWKKVSKQDGLCFPGCVM
jgi:hypothetical protein